jgi:hypothetical protein
MNALNATLVTSKAEVKKLAARLEEDKTEIGLLKHQLAQATCDHRKRNRTA